jgi:NADH dehydrogenase
MSQAFTDEDGDRVAPPRTVDYDTLVICIGSRTNDFGTPGAHEYAIALDDPVEAERFHRRLVNAYMRAHTQSEPLRPEQLHVAIIGAGATGVELAAELHNTTRTLVSYGLDRIDPGQGHAAHRHRGGRSCAAGAAEAAVRFAGKLLENLGISVRTSARVAEVLPEGVRLASGEIIPAELVVWAAGVKAPDFLRDLDGLERTGSTSSSCGPRCRRRVMTTCSRSATAPRVRGWGRRAPSCRRARRPRTSRRRTW